MRRLFTLRSFVSWLILLILLSALIAGLKEGVLNVQDAAFFPVAAFAVTLGYAFGFSTWSARRTWSIVLVNGLLVVFIESAKLVEPLRLIIRSIPQFELEVIRSLFEFIRWLFDRKNNIEIVLPDTTVFQIQIAEITTRAGAFTSLLLSKSIKQPAVREFIWDMPLLLLAAWSGWGTSRRNQTLLAAAPSLVLHTYILQYTGKDILSLQVAIFAFLLLIGVNQKWNIKTKRSTKTTTETYSAILVLSIALTIGAGFMPSISLREVAQKTNSKNGLGNTLGLDKPSAPFFISSQSGLPRQHLIGLSPELSQTVVFTVTTGEIAASENAIITEAVPRHYWRWLTYDVYNGQGWASSPTENNSYSANQSLLPNTNDGYKLLHLQVKKVFTQDNRLYWTGSLVNANQPFKISWRIKPESPTPFLSSDMLGGTTEKQSYQADSLLPVVSANQLRESAQTYPQEISKRYLAEPETIPQRVLELARKLTANIPNPYDKAKAIETYLRTYPYSLNATPPSPGKDVADYFLFDLKRGYCDYYATSMVVMARSVGLPARLVVGYSSGTYDPRKAEYVIREANAHSWVEVYFADVGWVEFEPTAGEPSLTLPNEQPSVTSLPILPEHEEKYFIKGGFLPQKNYVPLAVGLTTFITALSLWFLSAQGLLRAHKSISSIYKYVYYHGKKIYKDAPLHETPSVFADKLQGRLRSGYRWLIPAPGEIKFLTDLYLQEKYSAHRITKNERMYAVKVWRKLFWRLLYARVVLARTSVG